MSLLGRVARLEELAGPAAVQVIIIRGGLPEGLYPRTARVGALTLTQSPSESEQEFSWRAVRAAEATGVTYVVIGGLRKPEQS